MNALSLFSGIGGIDLACEWAGIKTVAFCEREPFCKKVLRKHWPHAPIYDDVCTLTREVLERDGIGTIDLIHGGYPCQPFSVAGKRRGAEDDRHLWPEYFRLVQEIRPRWVVGENVAGHVTLGLDDVLADLGGRVTPRKRFLYQLRPSAPATDETESSLWPTVTASDTMEVEGKFRPSRIETGRKTDYLCRMVKMWPTPAAQDAKNATLPPSQINRDTVPGAVMRSLWPTPTASQDWKPIRPLAPSEANGSHGAMLVGAVGHQEPQNVGGQLNPEWVEVLMNFPPGWTDVD